MAEHILINGKEYLPSNLLAARFKYTSDYIGKLAREEKILGLLIERQWFVEPSSLETFLHKISVEKEIKKEALRAERKRERITHERQLLLAQQQMRKESSALASFGESVAIVLCGVMLGGMGWVGYANGLSLSLVAEGTKATSQFVWASVVPQDVRVSEARPSQQVAKASQIAAVQGSGVQTAEISAEEMPAVLDDASVDTSPAIFTVLPVSILEATTTRAEEQVVTFSDEVRVVTDASGVHYLEPVFKTATTVKRFSLTGGGSNTEVE